MGLGLVLYIWDARMYILQLIMGIDINRERWEEQRPWMGALEEVKSRDKVIHQEAYP